MTTQQLSGKRALEGGDRGVRDGHRCRAVLSGDRSGVRSRGWARASAAGADKSRP